MTHEAARGYITAHNRVRKTRGPARKHTCPCGGPAAQWAYDHNDPNPRTEIMPTDRGGTVVVTWSDDPAHYIAMCYRCHARLDLERGNRSNIGVRYREELAATRAGRDQRREALYTVGTDGFRHLNGVAWHEEWVPQLGHSCWVQTSGRIGPDQYERCPCGAVRRNGRAWSDRNTRPRNRTARGA